MTAAPIYKQGRVYVTKDDRLIFRRKQTQTWKRHPPISAIVELPPMPETVITISHERGPVNVRFRRNR